MARSIRGSNIAKAGAVSVGARDCYNVIFPRRIGSDPATRGADREAQNRVGCYWTAEDVEARLREFIEPQAKRIREIREEKGGSI
jgi:hypothetical protein